MNEYEAYYEMRFDKKPKIVRKLRDGEESTMRPSQSSSMKGMNERKNAKTHSGSKEVKPKPSVSVADEPTNEVGLGITGQGVGKSSQADIERPEHRYISAYGVDC